MSVKLTWAGAAARSIEPARALARKATPRSAKPMAAGAAALRASSREPARARAMKAAPRSGFLSDWGSNADSESKLEEPEEPPGAVAQRAREMP